VAAAGLFIAGSRVGGTLAMTRAIGDLKYKCAPGACVGSMAVVRW
jgi:hypothetical protein